LIHIKALPGGCLSTTHQSTKENIMFKNLLVPYVNAATEEAPIAAAIALAERYEAHLAALVTMHVPTPVPSEWGVAPYDMYQQVQQQEHKRAQALTEKLRTQFSAAGVKAEVRMVQSLWLRPSSNAAMQARYADLCIVPSAPLGGSDSAIAHDYFQDLLLDSGAPVLVVPPKAGAVAAAPRVVIAWKPSRETSRAVHDAMPFLSAAQSIDILMIDPKIGEAGHGEDPGADIATHLARHGLKVQVVTRPRSGQTVATAILEHAKKSGTDLLIAGGYGHSRLREFVLGGVTRELLQTTTLPILFSH
jgi:nucleotide-binding universal stress UspA family protein